MNPIHETNRSGISSISEQATISTLALEALPLQLEQKDKDTCLLLQLLECFDALTSCNLRQSSQAYIRLSACERSATKNHPMESVCLALKAWSAFDYCHAKHLFVRHLHIYPDDVLAFFMLHMLEFCFGQTASQLTMSTTFGEHLSPTNKLRGYYLGIHAFILCEAGHIESAKEHGLAAIKTTANNIYAIHAVSHAFHESGQFEELINFLQIHENLWQENAGMRMHVCWHLSIAQLNLLNLSHARSSLEQLISMKCSPTAEQDLDSIGFLWRYKLHFPEDNRYEALHLQLADNWTGCIGASTSYFHDVHAGLAFLLGGRGHLLEMLIDRREDDKLTPTHTQKTGVCVLKALLAFERQDHESCRNLLLSTQPDWPLLGGSHAQREVLELTLQVASSRSGLLCTPNRLAAHKTSPLDRYFQAKQKLQLDLLSCQNHQTLTL